MLVFELGKFKQLTLEERKVIIEMYKNRDSTRKIACVFKKSHTTIEKVIEIFQQHHRIKSIKRQGRPKIMS